MGFFKKQSLEELRAETRSLEMKKSQRDEYLAVKKRRDALKDEVSGRKAFKETAGKVADRLAAAGKNLFDDKPRSKNNSMFGSPLLNSPGKKGKKRDYREFGF